MIRTKMSLVCAAVCASFAADAVAASYSITAAVVQRADTNTTSNVVNNPNIAVDNGLGTKAYLVEFYLTANGFGAGQRGFGNIDFNINFAGNSLVKNATFPSGWRKQDTVVIIDNQNNQDVLFQDNLDFGGNATDLQNVLVGIAAGLPADPNDQRQLYFNSNSNVIMGRVWVNWDGIGPETLTVAVNGASYANSSNGNLTTDTGATLIGTTVTFGGGVPEPSTWVLIGMAAPALLLAARRYRRSR